MDFTLDGEDTKDALQSLLESVPKLSRLAAAGVDGKDDVVALLRNTSPGGGLLCPLLAELHVQRISQRFKYARAEAKKEGLRRFCDALVGVLNRRASLGNRLTTLTVQIVLKQCGLHVPQEYRTERRPLFEAVLAEGGGLQARLGDSVGNVVVRFEDVD